MSICARFRGMKMAARVWVLFSCRHVQVSGYTNIKYWIQSERYKDMHWKSCVKCGFIFDRRGK